MKNILFQLDKPGTPGSKARSTTPNASSGQGGGPKSVMPQMPAGYPNSPYQRPQDPYQRPHPDPAYGRPPMPFDPHGHVRTNGIALPGGIAGGKP